MATKKVQDDAAIHEAAAGTAAVDETGAPAAASGKARKTRASAVDLTGPSPNPHTNLIIADIALRGGTFLARRAVEKLLLGRKYTPAKAAAILKGRGMGETMLHTTLARVAMQSVPGAILVGGGLIAKTLYDRNRARDAHAEGEAALEDMADDGAENDVGNDRD
jgi:hypothetical protein